MMVDRKLVPNPTDAETVRHIMRRYLEVGSVRALMEVLKREGVRSKSQTLRDGRKRGGIPFVRGPLYCLLKNPIYIGQIPHRKATYPGQHEAIVPRELWDEVQALMAKNGAERKFATNAADPSLLAGLMEDGQGRVLTPSHASKGHRRYRYYVSAGGGAAEGVEARPVRVPAGEIEKLLITAVAALLADKRRLADALAGLKLEPGHVHDAIRRWSENALLFPVMPVSEQRAILIQLNVRVVIEGERVEASYYPARLISIEAGNASSERQSQERVPIAMAGVLLRRGHELRLLYAADDLQPGRRRDAKLVSLIVKGSAARDELFAMQDQHTGAAGQARRAHLARMARTSYLAPDIIQAALAGTQPGRLTGRRILKAAKIPLNWDDQRRLFGFV